ncbi:MAG: hypothetical protein U0821_06340 [Chloroflexota bacterium]
MPAITIASKFAFMTARRFGPLGRLLAVIAPTPRRAPSVVRVMVTVAAIVIAIVRGLEPF